MSVVDGQGVNPLDTDDAGDTDSTYAPMCVGA